jgi:hypothetical protein
MTVTVAEAIELVAAAGLAPVTIQRQRVGRRWRATSGPVFAEGDDLEVAVLSMLAVAGGPLASARRIAAAATSSSCEVGVTAVGIGLRHRDGEYWATFQIVTPGGRVKVSTFLLDAREAEADAVEHIIDLAR